MTKAPASNDKSLDRGMGRALGRLLALIPFAIGVSLCGYSFRNRDQFEGASDVALTFAFIAFWFLLARWLWRMNRPLSDMVDD